MATGKRYLPAGVRIKMKRTNAVMVMITILRSIEPILSFPKYNKNDTAGQKPGAPGWPTLKI